MELNHKPSVLIVDDIDENIQLIEYYIASLDVEIIRAYTGFEALDKIRGRDLVVALLDIEMPEMDGRTLAARIHAERPGEVIPVIFITAYEIPYSFQEKLYQHGIIDFIIKPFHKSILVNKIKILLDLYLQRQKIRESEKKYRILLNSSPAGVILLDVEGNINEISSMAMKVFNVVDQQTFIGRHFTVLFPEDEHTHVHDLIAKTLEGGLAQNIEFKLTQSDGSQFYGELSATIITNETGAGATLMTVIHDITGRKEMESFIIRTERLAGLGEMAAGIAHEINQPLNTISIGLENLLNELSSGNPVVPDYINKKASKIFENISRIDYIIDNVRTFSRMDHKDIKTDFSINESIINAIDLVSGQMSKCGLNVVSRLDKNYPSVKGNPWKFEQVIVNLLVNAKDAIEDRRRLCPGHAGTIVVSNFIDKSLGIVTVTDDGIGIAAEDIEKMVFPFYTTKEAGRGTGLGLTIADSIIREMNGTLHISSIYGNGTTIRIEFPCHETDKLK